MVPILSCFRQARVVPAESGGALAEVQLSPYGGALNYTIFPPVPEIQIRLFVATRFALLTRNERNDNVEPKSRIEMVCSRSGSAEFTALAAKSLNVT